MITLCIIVDHPSTLIHLVHSQFSKKKTLPRKVDTEMYVDEVCIGDEIPSIFNITREKERK